MKIVESAELKQFREECRDWLADNVPKDRPDDGKAMRDFDLAWQAKQFEGGWAGINWPKEYGGRGASVLEQLIWHEEYALAGGPPSGCMFVALSHAGPTLIVSGNEEQKSRYLPTILNGTENWCQGFSEPGAGSDLASLKCKGEIDGDDLVINGTKIWTTYAQHARWQELLIRTDPNETRHRGLTWVICDMQAPGLEVRPIRTMAGLEHFAQCFYDDVRIPLKNVVGEVNQGWKTAMTTLGFERGTSATTGYHRFRAEREELFASARRTGRAADPVVRQKLAQAWIVTEIMRVNGYRSLTNVLLDRSEPALDMTHKVFWTDYSHWSTKLAIDVLGMDGQILTGQPTDVRPGSVGLGRRPQVHEYPASPLQQSFFFARGESIYGGTSEIQRNLVAERVLGLPKGP